MPLPKADKYIWAIYIAILVISVIELYSASSREVTATNVFGPLLRHGQMLVLGAIITVLISRMHYRWLIPLTPIFVTLTILLGVYVLFKGDIINGARRSTTLLGHTAGRVAEAISGTCNRPGYEPSTGRPRRPNGRSGMVGGNRAGVWRLAFLAGPH